MGGENLGSSIDACGNEYNSEGDPARPEVVKKKFKKSRVFHSKV